MGLLLCKVKKFLDIAQLFAAEIGQGGTALSFKIPSHYREMCYFIARAVRMERAQPLIFKKISVLKIWSSGRFLVTLWVNIKQLR
jgi:hypothetical protein